MAPDTGPVAVFRREFDDPYFSRVLAHEDTFPSGPRRVLKGYRGFDISFFSGRVFAVDQALGTVVLEELSESEIQRYQDCGSCFIASSAAEVKEQVDQHVFARTEARLQVVKSLQADLRSTAERLFRLERIVANGSDASGWAGLDREPGPITPWYRTAGRVLRKAWRRLRVSFTPKAYGAAPPPLQERS
jgi:hypothetical protein